VSVPTLLLPPVASCFRWAASRPCSVIKIPVLPASPRTTKSYNDGLVAEQKSSRIANYIKNIHYEVGIIAHSCGAHQPHELSRRHVRIVQENGTSTMLADIYPDKTPKI